MSKVEKRQRAALEGQMVAGQGKRGGPPLHIGLAGALHWVPLIIRNNNIYGLGDP